MDRHEELVEQLLLSLVGTVQKALRLITSERYISYFCSAQDEFIAREKVLFLKGIRPKCIELLYYYELHSPEEWKRLPENFPEAKAFRKAKRELKFLWGSKPRNIRRKNVSSYKKKR